jgi:hypothetical protein
MMNVVETDSKGTCTPVNSLQKGCTSSSHTASELFVHTMHMVFTICLLDVPSFVQSSLMYAIVHDKDLLLASTCFIIIDLLSRK